MPEKTGPFYASKQREVPSPFYEWKMWYRSKPKKSIPLPFELLRIAGGVNSFTGVHLTDTWDSDNRALSKAHDKYRDKLKSELEALLLVNILERQQTFDMLAEKINLFRKVYQDFRRGNLSGLTKSLGKAATRDLGKKFRVGSKHSANRFLEWHFGWAPLIGDIYAITEILDQTSIDGKTIRCVSRDTSGFTETVTTWYGNWFERTFIVDMWSLVKLQCKAKVTSFPLVRANQLGLINPLAVAWEIVPFSFLVDWFIPLGAYIDSYTCETGWSIEGAFTTRSKHMTSVVDNHLASGAESLDNWIDYAEGWHFRRQEGIAHPPLAWLPPKRLSNARAATAISLLRQSLKR